MLVMTRGAFFLLLFIGALIGIGVWYRRRGHVLLATALWSLAATLLALLILGASGLVGT
ncbi:MAG: hypothetical protein AABY83_02100 [Pseudomonadota bacterium]